MHPKLSDRPKRLIHRLSHLLERTGAYAQGKGYGTSTIEQEVKQVHRLLVRRPKLAVDIGGNVGDYTAELLRRTPDLEVHVFEPSRINIERLSVRFAGQARIKILPVAVSDSAGAATLYANEPGSGLGTLAQRNLTHFNIVLDHTETIQTMRFEDYWRRELREQPVDIVKIDIEGHELTALAGFGDAIHAIGVLQFEFGGCNIDTRTFFQDFWYFFAGRNFDIFRITPLGLERIERYRESEESFSATNFIALNRAAS
jgi:FkbM family methyltransferase